MVSQGHKFTEGPAVDRHGNVFFTDIPNNRIHKISTDGKVSVFKEDTGGANGLMFGPDGRLYACQNGRKRLVAYAMDGTESVIAEGMGSNDLAINSHGEIYFSDPGAKKVWFIDRTGREACRGAGGDRVSERRSTVAGSRAAQRCRLRQQVDLVIPGPAGWFARERASVPSTGD
jgi:sugar lactone lactonase YvrE